MPCARGGLVFGRSKVVFFGLKDFFVDNFEVEIVALLDCNENVVKFFETLVLPAAAGVAVAF